MWRVQEGLSPPGAHSLHPAQGSQLLQVSHVSLYTLIQAISKSWQCHKRFDQILVELSFCPCLHPIVFRIYEHEFRREEKVGKGEQEEGEEDEGDVRSSKDRSYASLGSPSVSGSGQVGNRHEYFSFSVLLEGRRKKRLFFLRRSRKREPLKARSSLRLT